MIFNPSITLKTFFGFINRPLIGRLRLLPGVCISKSSEAICETISSAVYEIGDISEILAISMDGSSFDSTQNLDLKMFVDNYLYPTIVDWLYPRSPFLQTMKISYIKTMCMTHSYLFRMRLRDRRVALIGLLQGTVKSGHPTDTTAMNTCRSLYYSFCIENLAGCKITRVVAGGDMVLFFDKRNLDRV